MINRGRLPYCSDSGPQKRGPTQYPARKSEIVRVPTSSENLKCSVMGTMTPDGADDENVLKSEFIRVNSVRIDKRQNVRVENE